jgi:hypothetical protein
MRKLTIITALAILLGVSLATSAPAVTQSNKPGVVGIGGSAGSVRPWSVQYMNGSLPVTLDQALATARSFDTIAALPKVYKTYVSQMKAANPNLQLFVYSKGPFTYDTTLPEAAYSHDVNGSRIQGAQYSTWLLDPVSPLAIAAQAAAASKLLTSSGYDGVFLDTLGVAALNCPQFVKALPINPATGLVWTAPDWINATAAMAGQIAAQIGKPVIGNGLRDGKNYFDPGTRQLLRTGLRGAMAEAWLRGAMNPVTAYPKELIWKQNIDAVIDAGANGASFLAVTKVWTTGTQAEKDAWYKYTLASFLLANDGNAYLSFSYDNGDATVDYPWNHLDLGAPTGAYAKVDNVYQRSFAAGRVLVNPTKYTYTVQLGATYHTLAGAAVTSVTLAPNASEILTP